MKRETEKLKKLAIITTHPIQYNAPWFRLLNKGGKVIPKVFYTWGQLEWEKKYDPGFGKEVKWDIPLLEGYQYTFVENISLTPGSHHRKGIMNPSLNKEIELWQPDAVLVFGWNFVSHLKCIRYFHKKIPVLFRGDSTLLDETKGLKTFLRRIFLKWVYRNIDFAFYVGTNNKKYFLAHGLKNSQLVYAPHAVDNERFAQPNDSYYLQAAKLKEQLNIKVQDVVLLFAGKLEPKKNPFFLLQLLKKHTNARLKVLFIGNGQLEAALKIEAAKDERILFLDFQNQQQMPVVYRLGAILVLPSVGPGETWGMALNEAMACGKAIAASNKTGGAIDLIQEGKNGVVINFEDYKEMDRLIEMALQDASLLNEMGKSSLEIIKQFSYTNIVNSILSLVNSF